MRTIRKNLFYLIFLCCFCENFQAEEKEQNVNLEDLNLGNIDLENLKNLFDTEEMKQIFGNEKILELLGKKPLSKNYFYSTNIGLGLHNNFADTGHKFQNWRNAHLRFEKTKKDIKVKLAQFCQDGGNLNYDFYTYKNFVQSLLSNSFYINPSWNFQLKKSNFFAHVGIFFEKITSKYSYNFVFAKKKEEENKEDNKEEEIKKIEEGKEEDDGFLRTNVSTRFSFDTLKIGPSFGFSWYSNKLYPWASWNFNLMFSVGFQIFYGDFFDFGFYKWGKISGKVNYDFKDKNNPNTGFVVNKVQDNPLIPLYFLCQISVGYNKFSIWFRIYSPFFNTDENLRPVIIPNSYRDKINDNFKPEYLDSKVELNYYDSFPILISKLNFAFGFSYVF